MSTSWRVFVFMYLLLALLLSVNSSLWKDPQKSYPSLREMRTNTLRSLPNNILNNWRKGDDPDMVRNYQGRRGQSLIRACSVSTVDEEKSMGRVSIQRWQYDWIE